MSNTRQRAWETAMGMLGYAGSPAQKEDRKQGQKPDHVLVDKDGDAILVYDVNGVSKERHFFRSDYDSAADWYAAAEANASVTARQLQCDWSCNY